MDDLPELMTPAETAGELHVSPKSLYMIRKRGELRSVMTPGGTHRYFADEVRALSRKREEAPD